MSERFVPPLFEEEVLGVSWRLLMLLLETTRAVEAREIWCGGEPVEMELFEGDDCCWSREFWRISVMY